MESTAEGDSSRIASTTPQYASTSEADDIQLIFASSGIQPNNLWGVVKEEPLDVSCEEVVQKNDPIQNVCVKQELEEFQQSSCITTSTTTNLTRPRQLNDTNESHYFDERLDRVLDRNYYVSPPASDLPNLNSSSREPENNLFHSWQSNIDKIRVTDPSGKSKDLTFVPNFTPITTQRQVSVETNNAKPLTVPMTQIPNNGKRKRGRPPGQKNKKPRIVRKTTYPETFQDNLQLLSHLCVEQGHSNPFTSNPVMYGSLSAQNAYSRNTSHIINDGTKNKSCRKSTKSRRKIVTKDTQKSRKSVSDLITRSSPDTHFRNNQICQFETDNEAFTVEKNPVPCNINNANKTNSDYFLQDPLINSPQKSDRNSFISNAYACSSTDDEETAVVYKVTDSDKTRTLYNHEVIEECLIGNTGRTSAITVTLNSKEYENNPNVNYTNCINLKYGKIWPNTHDWKAFNFLVFMPNENKYYIFDPKTPVIAQFPRTKITNSLCYDVNCDSSASTRRNNNNDNYINSEENSLLNLDSNTSCIQNEYFDNNIAIHSHTGTEERSTEHTENQYKLFQLEIRNNNARHWKSLNTTTTCQSYDCDNFSLTYETIKVEEAEKIINLCKPSKAGTSSCANFILANDLPSSDNYTICFWGAQQMQVESDTNMQENPSDPTTPQAASVILQIPCRRLLGLSNLPFEAAIDFVRRNQINFPTETEVARFKPGNGNLPHAMSQALPLQRNYDIENNVSSQRSINVVSENESIIKEEPLNASSFQSSFNQSTNVSSIFSWRGQTENNFDFETDNNDECVIIDESRPARKHIANVTHCTKSEFDPIYYPEVSQNSPSHISQQLSNPGNCWQVSNSFEIEDQNNRLLYEENQLTNSVTSNENHSLGYNPLVSNNENRYMPFENYGHASMQEAINTNEKRHSTEFNSVINLERNSNYPINKFLGNESNANFSKKYIVHENMPADVLRCNYAFPSHISSPNSLHPTTYIQSYLSPQFQPEYVSNSNSKDFNERENHFHVSDSRNFACPSFPRSNEERVNSVSLGFNRFASQQIQTHSSDINYGHPAKIGILEQYVNNFDKQQNSHVRILPVSSFPCNEATGMTTRRSIDREINPAYRFNSGGNIINQNVPNDSNHIAFSERPEAYNYTSPTYTTLCAADQRSPMNLSLSTPIPPLPTSSAFTKSQSYCLENMNKENPRGNNQSRNAFERNALTCRTERSQNYSPLASEMPIDLQINSSSIGESRFDRSPNPHYSYSCLNLQSSAQVQPTCESQSRMRTTNFFNNFSNSSLHLEKTINENNYLSNSYTGTQSSSPESDDFHKQVDSDNVINRMSIVGSPLEEEKSDNTVSEYHHESMEMQTESQALSKKKVKCDRPSTNSEHYREVFDTWYKSNQYPDLNQRLMLASKTGLEQTRVNTWFKNRRQRDRRNAGMVSEKKKSGRKPRNAKSTGLDEKYVPPVPSDPSMPVFPTTHSYG